MATGGALTLNGNITGTNVNGSASAVTGTFAGLANNTTFVSGQDTFRINYFDTGDGTAGNDISLSVVAVPEPATWLSSVLLLGLLGISTWQRRVRQARLRRSEALPPC